jgi:hypothetical protein
MGEISFLIGSGFSHPAGYPIATCLNRKLRQIKASEITIHTSGSARFLNKGENDPFRIPFIPRDGQREFVEAFLKFYTSTIIGDAEKFEYEEFFDYYIDLFGKSRHSQEEEKFFTSFREHSVLYRPVLESQLIANFDRTFQQLIADLLAIRESPCKLKPYDGFLALLNDLSRTVTVHFHTLNHDTFFEHLHESGQIESEICDGFDENDSTYSGPIGKGETKTMVKLPMFRNRFGKGIRLYKLHGSIDFYRVEEYRERREVPVGPEYSATGECDFVRHKRGVDIEHLKREGENVLRYMPYVVPSFLTGQKTKSKNYGGPYYRDVFDHFTENLRRSRALIVVGYGWRDKGINEDIKKYFCAGPRKRPLLVVDLDDKSTSLIPCRTFQLFKGGVESASYDTLRAALSQD